MSFCKSLFFSAALLLLAARFAAAQSLQGDEQAYCAYVDEQARAQSDLLRTPIALAGFTQPETGLPTQLVAGVSLSLSNLKKAGITLDAAHRNCELYKSATSVNLFLQYAIPGIEKDALTHRLALIDQASQSLDTLIDKTNKMIAAENMTRPMLQVLVGDRIKLDSDRADTESKIAALYVPSLPAEPLSRQVAAKQSFDVAEQQSLSRLQRQNSWDVSLSVGTHQQINPPAGAPEPYGQVTVSYNLASRAIDRHLDHSVAAYGDWKKVQESDVARGMQILRGQIEDTIAAQQKRLDLLTRESASLNSDLKLTADPNTSAALDFRNQVEATQLLLAIETGDSSYRLELLRAFLKINF